MKILVIGFQRSGTTLTRKLIEAHPDVSEIFHEKRILNKPKKLAEIEYKIWGDKVPWNSMTGNEIIDYANRWAKKFNGDYRIIHVMRNPEGAARSNIRLGWLGGFNLAKRIEESVKKVHNKLKHLNYKAFRLEDLTAGPKAVLSDVYNFCELRIEDGILNNTICGDPNATKRSSKPIEKSKLPPYEGYKEFI